MTNIKEEIEEGLRILRGGQDEQGSEQEQGQTTPALGDVVESINPLTSVIPARELPASSDQASMSGSSTLDPAAATVSTGPTLDVSSVEEPKPIRELKQDCSLSL